MKKITAPFWWTNLSRALRFLLASLILNFSTSNMYSQDQTMKIIFWFGIGLLLIQTSDIFLDVKKIKNDDEDVEIPKKP